MKKNESLIIDCQILQTAAFDRGMGKYTTSLLKAVSANKEFTARYERVYILLNSNLNISKDRISLIQSLVNNSKLLKLDLPIDISVDNLQKLDSAKKIVSDACNNIGEKSKISFLVMAPFFVGFSSVFPEQREIKKYSLVYDFIPYRIWNKQRIFPDEIYFQHFKLFLDADHLFTISEFVRHDLVELFGFSKSKVTSIDGGPFEQTVPENIGDKPIEQKYIIYPSAPIIHKNNIKAVMGFERFNSQQKDKFKLIITSTFDDKTKDILTGYSKDVIFTGNVSDQELYRYYHHASTLLFASLSEGLGMPILEAVGHNIPIACSEIPVLTEISDNGLYLFNPTNANSISTALKNAVDRKGFVEKQKSYQEIEIKYSWDRSASILLKSLNIDTDKVKNKKSLLIISNLSTGDSKQARFIEHTFSQFYKNYDVSLQFKRNQSSKQKLPSYVAYLGFSQKTDNFDLTIEITKRKLFIITKRNFNIQVVSTNQILTHKKGTISIMALKNKVDKALQFNDWKYSLAGKKESTAEQIVDKIMDEVDCR